MNIEAEPATAKQPTGASAVVEDALDEADKQAATLQLRYTHDEVFGSVKSMLSNAST